MFRVDILKELDSDHFKDLKIVFSDYTQIMSSDKDALKSQLKKYESSESNILSQAKKWQRFKDRSTGTWHISSSNIDAVQFIPKTDIMFLGFGAYANYHKKEATQTIWWRLDDDEKGEEIDILQSPDDVDEES